jgi:hypothetical protein
MKSLQKEMASGVGYYEGELYNLIREGHDVPAVPLILIGVAPMGSQRYNSPFWVAGTASAGSPTIEIETTGVTK